MSRIITGFKPTGSLQLGNYVGAIRPLVEKQDGAIAFVADLHAMTVRHEPRLLRERTLEAAKLLLACGVDPDRCTLYLQSHVTAHTTLHYLLECVASDGEARRMIQYKEKGGAGSRLSLLTYPVLMASDILLYDIDEVPVGIDQRQHLELTRDLAVRFNATYGETFVVPRATHPPYAARIADLSDPHAKMGKTNASGAGVVFLLDGPDVVRRKIMRAVTDAETEVRYDPDTKPGVSNLLEILAACTGGDPKTEAERFTSYGALKTAAADAVIALLGPIQERFRSTEPEEILRAGAAKARATADATVARATEALGLMG
jgi:tryptophanyl-tRNA synthetase